MEDFKERFEIIYKKYYDWGIENGFKPSKLAFSRFVGVTQGRMQCWERGQVPAGKDLKTIHDKLGFAYDWLIAGEGEMLDLAAIKIAGQQREIERLQLQIRVEGATDQGAQTGTKAAGQG